MLSAICREFLKIGRSWRTALDPTKAPAPVWRRSFRITVINMCGRLRADFRHGRMPGCRWNRKELQLKTTSEVPNDQMRSVRKRLRQDIRANRGRSTPYFRQLRMCNSGDRSDLRALQVPGDRTRDRGRRTFLPLCPLCAGSYFGRRQRPGSLDWIRHNASSLDLVNPALPQPTTDNAFLFYW